MSLPKLKTNAGTDLLVVGGGVIGLSIAYEAARSGATVRLIERGQIGRQASWAGAGILPPGSLYSDHPSLEALAKLSGELYPRWSAELLEATGIDNQFERLGARYLLESPSGSSECDQQLRAKFIAWRQRGIAVEEPTASEPWYTVPDEAQVRNTRHLAALEAACRQLGVKIVTGMAIDPLASQRNRVREVTCQTERWECDQLCLAAGAWTGGLLEQVAPAVSTPPVRGQMLLLKTPTRSLHRNIHSGGRYLVPRQDGHVLVGATLEQVGFDATPTDESIDDLQRFACEIVPELSTAQRVGSWAGLRPGTPSGLPYIGPIPSLENGWIASGHFRSGLQFSTGTAVLLCEMLLGTTPSIDCQALTISNHELQKGEMGTFMVC